MNRTTFQLKDTTTEEQADNIKETLFKCGVNVIYTPNYMFGNVIDLEYPETMSVRELIVVGAIIATIEIGK